MRGFRFNQALGDNADSFTARRQHGICHDPHQSFLAAAMIKRRPCAASSCPS